MELTEKERLLIMEKKEEIIKLTEELIDIEKNSETAPEVKKKITRILGLLSTIASYAGTKGANLGGLTEAANSIFMTIELVSNLAQDLSMLNPLIGVFSNAVNSVEFNITKGGIKIVVPRTDLSLFKLPR